MKTGCFDGSRILPGRKIEADLISHKCQAAGVEEQCSQEILAACWRDSDP
jgi:hypothetical protein